MGVHSEIAWRPDSAEGAVEPILSFGTRPTPYSEYAGIDRLHELVRPRSDEPAEVSFIATTQVMELLFALLRHEWTGAQRALRADDLAAAMDALRRGLHVQDVLIGSWDLLASLTPGEFSAFRERLGEGSGFQSAAYRRLEFLLGNKQEGMLRPHQGSPAAHAELTGALHAPSLYDDVLALLDRRGLPVPRAVLERDPTRPYEPDPGVAETWRRVYAAGDVGADGSPGATDRDLVRLAELLLDVAERVTRWRQRHLTMVRRALGAKPGTGGSSGLTWLRRAVDRDVFPELWSVRNGL